MSLVRPAALAILVASLGANAVLARALTRGSVRPEVVDEAAATDPTREGPAPQRRWSRPSGKNLGACAGEIDELERDVGAKSEALRAVLPAPLLFAGGQRNAEAERLVRPIVAEAIAPLESSRGSHRLECKDVACKLVFSHPATLQEDAWDRALARHAHFQAATQDLDPGETVSIEDAATRQPLLQRTLFFKLRNGQGGR